MAKLWHYNQAGECVAENLKGLPQPLVHMLANGTRYFSICDNFLRGYSGFDYTRMFGEFDGPNFPKGNARFLWFRFGKGETWLANNFFKPLDKTEKPSFKMGLGYVTFENTSKKYGVSVKADIYVPLEKTQEIWLVEVKNTSKKSIRFDFIPAVPIFGGSRAYTEYHRDVVRLYNKSRVTDRIEILPGLEWVEGKTNPSDICYYMTAETSSGKKGTRLYSDRETFLGNGCAWAYPEAVTDNKAPKFQCLGKEAVGAIEFKGIVLKPGETAKFVVSNGISHGSEETEKAAKEATFENALFALDKLKALWNER
jgi:cellobiose phosphorylase